jgi:tRNA-2-methylthio-N6-dimethylallyladenosine synthase
MKVYGCQMNVCEGDRLRTAMVRRGWVESGEEDADVVVFIGCSVRDKAERKVWSELGRYAEPWKRAGRPVVALTGCVAQNLGEAAMNRYPWVRLVSGPRHVGFLPDALERAANGERLSLLDEDPREFHDLGEFSMLRDVKCRAYVTIANGCDNFCSYCIVPFVRGRFVSRPAEDVMREVRELVDDGAKEIILLGQNVNSYGNDWGGQGDRPSHFAELLRSVAREVPRVRFVTSLPQDFGEDTVRVMASEPSVCPSLSLPIQSGSDRVLRLMNRRYTRAEYFAKVAMARSALPGLAISSDLIVGFPGETERDFEDSLSALSELRFDALHSAAYSERAGTRAATMPDSVPREVRMQRLSRVNALQAEIVLSINRSLVGSRQRVLVEGFAPNNGLLQGRTPSDKVVVFDASPSIIGSFADVTITEAHAWYLSGEVFSFSFSFSGASGK